MGSDGLMIEMTGEAVTGVPAIQSDSLFVFDQWCIARGQSRSKRAVATLKPPVSIKRRPVKSIRANLSTANTSKLPENVQSVVN